MMMFDVQKHGTNFDDVNHLKTEQKARNPKDYLRAAKCEEKKGRIGWFRVSETTHSFRSPGCFRSHLR